VTPDRTYVALLHHPVVNHQGRLVATAVTNLDVHDIARACRTFGLGGFYLATPLPPQQRLVERILSHWQQGYGARHNPDRSEALSRVRLAPDLDEAVRAITEAHGHPPFLVATSARDEAGALSLMELRHAVGGDRPVLLVFGTGWGLADEVFARVDARLAPLHGPTDYNHLSVRSAVSIYLDRLFGDRGS
jgi:hypothetical protein